MWKRKKEKGVKNRTTNGGLLFLNAGARDNADPTMTEGERVSI